MGVGRWHRPVVISANGGAGRAVGEKAVGGHHPSQGGPCAREIEGSAKNSDRAP